jgi:hypothetical protein
MISNSIAEGDVLNVSFIIANGNKAIQSANAIITYTSDETPIEFNLDIHL